MIDANCHKFLRYYSSLEVASEYFRSGADKVSIGSDAVYAAEEYLKTGVCDTCRILQMIDLCYFIICFLTDFANNFQPQSQGKNWEEQSRADLKSLW